MLVDRGDTLVHQPTGDPELAYSAPPEDTVHNLIIRHRFEGLQTLSILPTRRRNHLQWKYRYGTTVVPPFR